jgi:hypothetical protein
MTENLGPLKNGAMAHFSFAPEGRKKCLIRASSPAGDRQPLFSCCSAEAIVNRVRVG